LGAVDIIKKNVYQEISDFLKENDHDAPYTLHLLRRKIREELDKE